MADDNQIKIVLTLDDSQLKVKLDGDTVAAKKLTLAFGGLEKKTGRDVPKANKAASGSLQDLGNRLNDAKRRLDSLTASHPKYEAALKRVRVLHDLNQKAIHRQNLALTGGTDKVEKFGAATGRTGFAVLNMNRVISDSPFGFIAISNNIEPLVQSMVMLRNDAGGLKNMFIGLGKSMIGPLGLMTAISLVTAIMTRLSMSTSKTKTETKNFLQELDNVNERLKIYKGNFEDLARAQELHRKTLIKTNIAEAEGALGTLNARLGKGGRVVKGEFIPFDTEQKKVLTDNIAAIEKKIEDYNTQLNEGNKFVKANIELMKQLAEVAVKEGAPGIKKFAEENKLSEGQIGNMLALFKEYKTDIMNVAGGLAKELPDGARAFGIALGMQRDELLKTILALDDYNSALSGETKTGKTKKPKERSLNITGFEIKPLLKIDNQALTTAQRKLFTQLQTEFKSNGITWDAEAQMFALTVALNLQEPGAGNVPTTLSKVKEEPGPKIEFSKEQLAAFQEELSFTNSLATQLGSSLADAFMQGKLSVESLIKSVTALALKLTFIKGFQILLSGGNPLSAIMKKEGGIVGVTKSPKVKVDPIMFAGAPHFAKGGIMGGGIPALLHPNEMVLTPQDQVGLLSFIRGFAADKYQSKGSTQKFVHELRLRKNGKEFVGEFKEMEEGLNELLYDN